MASIEDARIRSTLMSERIRERTDMTLRELITNFDEPLSFHPMDDLMISPQAWKHVDAAAIEPKLVFAHPVLLRKLPRTSQHYRGVALLPRKRVADIAVPVAAWEDGTRKTAISEIQAKDVARLYNAVISSIIEGTTDWTLENGYRNVIANMGIGLDGTFRNIIGQDAERLIKTRISNWLDNQGLIEQVNDEKTEFHLPRGYFMRYGSEPDILFLQEQQPGEMQLVATIEIKGGKDPAGALERLGAMQKSFEATPPECVNMLVAGIVTPEMRNRLNEIGVVKVYLLDDLTGEGSGWLEFANEVFHYTVRVSDTTFT